MFRYYKVQNLPEYFVIIFYPTTRYIITIPEMHRSFTSLTKEQITQRNRNLERSCERLQTNKITFRLQMRGKETLSSYLINYRKFLNSIKL